MNILLKIDVKSKNLKNISQKIVKERLRIASEQMQSQQAENRVGLIYDLEHLANDDPQHYWTIMNMLTIFVRVHASKTIKAENNSKPLLTIQAEIQAALTVIGRRDTNKDPDNAQIDLSYTDMREVDLSGANLELANLYKVNLSGSNLSGANLSGAILSAANLSDTNLTQANLSGAILSAANLEDANLSGANLSQANLYLANLQGATLKNVNLNGANLREAKFSVVEMGTGE